MNDFVDDSIHSATIAAKAVFRGRPNRDELVDRTISMAWEFANSAPEAATPESIAQFAVGWVKLDRDFKESVRSLNHPRHNRRRQRLAKRQLRERMDENPAFIVQVKEDFREFVTTLTRRQRTIARLYMMGNRTSEIAARLGVTDSAVSQTRAKLFAKWRKFTGDAE